MDIAKFPESALNIAFRASDQIFFGGAPDNTEKAILYALVKNGPQSLAELVKTISNFGGWEANHYTIKRRIDGLRNYISLTGFEFLIERDPEIRRRGKEGKIYHLSTKGFLAAFSTGLSFDRMDIFKKYRNFLKAILDRKIKYIGENSDFDSTLDDKTKENILETITLFIKYQILVFLIWHEANETLIRKKRNFNWYLQDFFENHNEFIYEEFPMLLEERIETEYREILRQYFKYSKILHGLINLSDTDENKKIRDNMGHLKPFVFQWFRYFDYLQMQNDIGKPYDIKKIPSVLLSRPEYGIEIEWHGLSGHKKRIQPDIKKETQKDLEELLGKKIPINEIWNKPHNLNKTEVVYQL